MKLVPNLAVLALLLGCDQPRATGSGGLGIEGTTCSKTFDCERPLQCFNELCTAAIEDLQDAPDVIAIGDTNSQDAPADSGSNETNSDATENDITNDVDLHTTPDIGPETPPDITEVITAPSEQCINAPDEAVICSGTQDPTAKAGACGQSTRCIGLALQSKFAEFEDCTRACMLDAARPNFSFVVSGGCTECYVDSARCTAEQCLGACASNPSSEACVTCREEKGCTSSFFACAGDIQAACTP